MQEKLFQLICNAQVGQLNRLPDIRFESGQNSCLTRRSGRLGHTIELNSVLESTKVE